MECVQHPNKDATGTCIHCGRAVCEICDFVIKGKIHCKSCASSYLKKLDNELKLSFPERVFCGICGRTKSPPDQYHVCDVCGQIACSTHWQTEENSCQTCYDGYLQLKIDEAKKTGFIRPCPACGTENLLTWTQCRSRTCNKSLPPLINATEIRQKNIPCVNHSNRAAYVKCEGCGKHLCFECESYYRGKNYCSTCLNTLKTLEDQARKKSLALKMKISAMTIGAVVILILIVWSVSAIRTHQKQTAEYDRATELINKGDYDGAIKLFTSLADFGNSSEKVEEARIKAHNRELAAGKAAEAKGDLERQSSITKWPTHIEIRKTSLVEH